MRETPFKSEADLCAAFIAWATGHGVRCYAEWAGWDILLVYPDGFQLGIQAKLRLNAEVLNQTVPHRYSWGMDATGPDFRGVLVPARTALSVLAADLGLLVFHPRGGSGGDFYPSLDYRQPWYRDDPWTDWNPARRHDLPPVATDAVAGSPCPVTLTPWKLGALDVLAELAVKGPITTKRMRALGVNPARWLSGFWLLPGDSRGLWVRGDRCPKFDEQHPTAYAVALDRAQQALAQ